MPVLRFKVVTDYGNKRTYLAETGEDVRFMDRWEQGPDGEDWTATTVELEFEGDLSRLVTETEANDRG
jgi:hypothetical protein